MFVSSNCDALIGRIVSKILTKANASSHDRLNFDPDNTSKICQTQYSWKERRKISKTAKYYGEML